VKWLKYFPTQLLKNIRLFPYVVRHCLVEEPLLLTLNTSPFDWILARSFRREVKMNNDSY